MLDDKTKEIIAPFNFKHPAGVDEVPTDKHWHSTCHLKLSKSVKTKKTRLIPQMVVAHYNGRFWTDGTTLPAKPLSIIAWDRDVRFEYEADMTDYDDTGVVRLGEMILSNWRREYMQACRTHDGLRRTRLEGKFPDWLIGDQDKEQIFAMLRKDAEE